MYLQRRLAFAVLMLLAGTSHAQPLLAFSAVMADVKWRLHSAPFECRLEQSIPEFGKVSLIQRADGKLLFEADVRKGLYQGQRVRLSLQPAPWQPGQTLSADAQESAGDTHDGLIRFGEAPARELMFALRNGHFATLDYTIGDQARVRAQISSLRFRAALVRLQTCVGKLKPVTFADYEKTLVHFATGSDKPSARGRARLARLAEYLRIFGGPVRIVRAIGNTDNVGSASSNFALGLRRAAAVERFLRAHGVTQAISIASQGEYRPVASNRTPRDRALNRRTTVVLIR